MSIRDPTFSPLPPCSGPQRLPDRPAVITKTRSFLLLTRKSSKVRETDHSSRRQGRRSCHSITRKGTGRILFPIFRDAFGSGLPGIRKETVRKRHLHREDSKERPASLRATVPYSVYSSAEEAGIVSTGHGATRTTRSVLLPRRNRFTPVSPRVAITMRPIPLLSAKSTMSRATSPFRT